MMRHSGKQILSLWGCLALAAAVGFCGAGLSARAAGLNQAVVTDPLTGYAIGGFDPVAYFTEGAALAGDPAFLAEWADTFWLFANEGNRDAFMANPDVYAPQFGGHGAMAMARGYLSDGNPQFFLVAGPRLYLFFSAANRDAFLAAPGPALAAAEAAWPKLKSELVGYRALVEAPKPEPQSEAPAEPISMPDLSAPVGGAPEELSAADDESAK